MTSRRRGEEIRERSIDFFGDVQQDADSGEGKEKARSAGRDKWQRDSLGGQQREHYADVEEGLEQNRGRESEGGEARKRFRGAEGGTQSAIAEHGEEDKDEHGAEEAQFFGDVGINKICRGFGKIEELLHALHV